MKKFSDLTIVFIFLIIPLLLRLWGLGDTAAYRGDEVAHVPAARIYIETGHTAPEYWYQPPLRHILLYGSIRFFGDNPYGWRMRNILFGALSVLLLFLLARELFPERRIAILAGMLLVFDPLHILFSRSTYGDIPALFFIIVSVYATVRYIRGKTFNLVISGCFLGLAMSMKWYYLPTLITLVVFTIFCKYKEGRLRGVTAAHILSALLFLPLSVYMLTFFAWFARGYGLIEFFQMQIDMYREQQVLRVEEYNRYLTVSSSPWEWYIKPIIFGFQIKTEGVWRQFLIFMNNPPVWLLTFPALSYAAYQVWKNRDRYVLLIFLLFVSAYFQFLFVKRPIFIYSALSVLPFVYLLIAFFIGTVLNKFKDSGWYYRIALSAIVIWGLYLYPLASEKTVPAVFYAPILSVGKILF